jgi:Cdc6-like AAA superfamily ATPase
MAKEFNHKDDESDKSIREKTAKSEIYKELMLDDAFSKMPVQDKMELVSFIYKNGIKPKHKPKKPKGKKGEPKFRVYKSDISRENNTPFGTSTFKQLIIGQPSSGKTCWAANIIDQYVNTMKYFHPSRIYLFSPNDNDLCNQVLPDGYHQFSSLFGDGGDESALEWVFHRISERKKKEHRSLIIIDDMLAELCKNQKNQKLVQLFTCDYHLQTSIILTTQAATNLLPPNLKDGISSIAFCRFLPPRMINNLKDNYMTTSKSKQELMKLYQNTADKRSDKHMPPLVWIKQFDKYLHGWSSLGATD